MSILLPQPEKTEVATFDALIRTHRDTAYRMAFRLTGGREAEAHDLVQEVFLRLWRRWDAYRPDSIKSWIYRVLQNLYLDAARKRKRHPTCSLEISQDGDFLLQETLPDKTPPPDAGLAQTEIKTQVTRALDQIDPEFRAPVVLCDMEGLSYEEIARRLNCPVGTVRSRIHRGRSQLRRLLPAFAAAIALLAGGWSYVRRYRILEARYEAQLVDGTWRQRIAPHARVALHAHHDLTQDAH